jgi:hypothetical protein
MVSLLIRFMPFFFRFNSSKGLGFTFGGYLIIGIVAIVGVIYSKEKIEDWHEKRDESRKVSAVIDSNKKTVDSLNQFNQEVKDGKEKIGTDDIYDAIN